MGQTGEFHDHVKLNANCTAFAPSQPLSKPDEALLCGGFTAVWGTSGSEDDSHTINTVATASSTTGKSAPYAKDLRTGFVENMGWFQLLKQAQGRLAYQYFLWRCGRLCMTRFIVRRQRNGILQGLTFPAATPGLLLP